MITEQNEAIKRAVVKNPKADQPYGVQTRGRPERDPREAARRILRRKHFGMQLRQLREGASLTLSNAAHAGGDEVSP